MRAAIFHQAYNGINSGKAIADDQHILGDAVMDEAAQIVRRDRIDRFRRAA